MKKINYILSMLVLLSMTACYERYDDDYEYTVVYFASQQPLRTTIADTDMSIRVGVAFGGTREVDTQAWATFAIEPALLDDTRFTLLPDDYYTLSDPQRMTVRNSNLAIADVEITFTDKFYNDPEAYNETYALPFRITGHDRDRITTSTSGELKDYSIVAIRAISQYHGTYYVKGEMIRLNADGTAGTEASDSTVYKNNDLSRNITRDLISTNRYTVLRPGFANTNNAAESIRIIVNPDGKSATMEAGGTTTLDNTTISFNMERDQPQFDLKYTFQRNGDTYRVEETLIRRQNPVDDLRFEEW